MTQINMYSSKEEIEAMTNEQAAEIISKFCSSGKDYDFSPRPHMAKANQLAVKALSEIDNLKEENSNLKEIISDLERERKNSFASGYNSGFKAGAEHGFSKGYSEGYKIGRKDGFDAGNFFPGWIEGDK